jgi:hypothetical protein
MRLIAALALLAALTVQATLPVEVVKVRRLEFLY